MRHIFKDKAKKIFYQLAAWMDIHFNFFSYYWLRKNRRQVEEYFGTIGDATDGYITEILRKIHFDSFLELGCSCGNRLFNIAREHEYAKIVGLDISPLAIKIGREFLKKSRIDNVELIKKPIERLGDFPEGSFDVVFSRATLIYISPRKIARVLSDIIRVSKKYIILMEMQGVDLSKDPDGTGFFCPPLNWKRDYVRLLKDLGIQETHVVVENVPEAFWSPGGGGATLIMFEKPENFS